MKSKSSIIAVLSLIMVVNSLSYGIIIPLIYDYATKFGLNPLQIGLLTTSFAAAQFFATPVLGRLSDRYGRKSILGLCLMGSAASLALMAVAVNAPMLFIARILDGITGGNISVAQAIISDTTEGEERTKAFGMIWGAFGVGFFIGPAIGGALGEWSLTAPYWFAAALALGAVAGIQFFLPESLKKSVQKQDTNEPLFKFGSIFKALTLPNAGKLLMINFFAAFAMNAMFMGFQSVTNDVFQLGSFGVGVFFSSFGLIMILMQTFGIGFILSKSKDKKKILLWSLGLSLISMLCMFFSVIVLPFFLSMCLFAVVSAMRDPMINALISEVTKPEDQGEILGINQSYMSLGQILGPMMAGVVGLGSLRAIFIASAAFMIPAVIMTQSLHTEKKKSEDI